VNGHVLQAIADRRYLFAQTDVVHGRIFISEDDGEQAFLIGNNRAGAMDVRIEDAQVLDHVRGVFIPGSFGNIHLPPPFRAGG
jgi:hypothetical protein